MKLSPGSHLSEMVFLLPLCGLEFPSGSVESLMLPLPSGRMSRWVSWFPAVCCEQPAAPSLAPVNVTSSLPCMSPAAPLDMPSFLEKPLLGFLVLLKSVFVSPCDGNFLASASGYCIHTMLSFLLILVAGWNPSCPAPGVSLPCSCSH